MTPSSFPEARVGVEAPVGVTRVEALRYRSLRYVDQPLRRFQVLVGPNGSGKSNFLDVLAFLSDVLAADLPTAIAGDHRWNIPLRAADGRDLLWMGKGRSFELAVEMAIPERMLGPGHGGRSVCRYEVKIDVTRSPRFVCETLWLIPPRPRSEPHSTELQAFPRPPRRTRRLARQSNERIPTGWRKVVFRGRESERVNFRDETSRWTGAFQIASGDSALGNLPADEARFPVALWFRKMLRGAQRIALSGDAMRRPCPPLRQQGYLSDGSNLPHVVKRLAEADPDQYERWIKHVREALPDVSGVATREREEDRYRYLVIEHSNGLEIPSWMVSDGTLRLLALTLLAYLPDLTGTYLIEEPENGLHPLAIETVFQSLSSVYGAQILLATHSPLVARLTEPDQLLCLSRDEGAGTDIVSGSRHPRLRHWQGSADLGTLLASGVLG